MEWAYTEIRENRGTGRKDLTLGLNTPSLRKLSENSGLV